MKAKRGYKRDKSDTPRIGNWLKYYFKRKTCRWVKHKHKENGYESNTEENEETSGP